LVSVISAALLVALAMFGGSYRALGILFLPLGLWFGIKGEQKQTEIRPAIQVLGWIFVGLAAVAVLASLVAIPAEQ
jgi:hypothetical protein